MSNVDIAIILILASAKTAKTSAKMPVKDRSKGPRTLIQDHPVSALLEFSGIEELQMTESSSLVLVMLQNELSSNCIRIHCLVKADGL